MPVYPSANYNTFLNFSEAATYFDARLHSDEYFSVNDPKELGAALVTAFHTLNELDITIDPTVAAELQVMKNAQCEQALHELKADRSSPIDSLAIPGLKLKKKERPRYSEKALAMLRPYMSMKTVSVSR